MNIKKKRLLILFFCFVAFLLPIATAPLTANAADMYVYFGTHSSGPGIGFSLSYFDTETTKCYTIADWFDLTARIQGGLGEV
jgi:hypothetical protein